MKKIFLMLIISSIIFTACKTVPKSKITLNQPLQSWNNTETKKSILSFVDELNRDGKMYFPNEERTVVIDFEGILTTDSLNIMEDFIKFSIKRLADKTPELKEHTPYKEVIENNIKWLSKFNYQKYMHLYLSYFNKMSKDTFNIEMKMFLDDYFDNSNKKLVSKPIKELVLLLQKNHFKVYIYSVYESEFIRFILHNYFRIYPEKIIAPNIDMEFDILRGEYLRTRIIQGWKTLNFNTIEYKLSSIEKHLHSSPLLLISKDDTPISFLRFMKGKNTMSQSIIYGNKNDLLHKYKNEYILIVDPKQDFIKSK